MRVRIRRHRLPAALVPLLTASLLAGCAQSAAPQAAPSSTAFPVTIRAGATPVTLAARPTRIVSLSPSLTEDLFAEGAGPQVVAVDKQSNYPPGVPGTELSGYTPNVEAIAGYHPDLVIISDNVNGLAASLHSLSIPVLIEAAPNTLNDVYTEMNQIGAATGHAPAAAALIQSTKARVASLLAQVPKRSPAPTYYYELDQTLYSLTSHTFVGSLFALAGMKNIADPLDKGTGYPQLSPETLVAANPDYVFLADTKCCAQNAATLRSRPGFATLSALAKGQVVNLDDDVASRWGPRITDLLAGIVNALKAHASPTP